MQKIIVKMENLEEWLSKSIKKEHYYKQLYPVEVSRGTNSTQESKSEVGHSELESHANESHHSRIEKLIWLTLWKGHTDPLFKNYGSYIGMQSIIMGHLFNYSVNNYQEYKLPYVACANCA